MSKEPVRTVDDYVSALAQVVSEGLPDKHLELLRAHFEAPRHAATAQELARKVGYRNYGAVNLQYGRLAHRVGNHLGFTKPPVSDGQSAWVRYRCPYRRILEARTGPRVSPCRRARGRALGFDGRDSLSPSELPRPLRRLKAGEIEDVLCLYADLLGRAMKGSEDPGPKGCFGEPGRGRRAPRRLRGCD